MRCCGSPPTGTASTRRRWTRRSTIAGGLPFNKRQLWRPPSIYTAIAYLELKELELGVLVNVIESVKYGVPYHAALVGGGELRKEIGMSVVPMKLLTIAGPLDRFDDVVRTCVIDQEFHPENALQLMRGVGGLRPLELENPYAALLRRSIEVADEAGIPLDYAPFDPTASLEEMAGYFDSLADQASALHRKQEELEHQLDEARSMVDQLQNLRGLDVKLDELWGLDHARFRYGYLPRETYDGFRDALDAEEDLFFVPTTVGRRRVYGVYFTTKESHHKVDSLMNSLHFTRIHLEEPPHGTVERPRRNSTPEPQSGAVRRWGGAAALRDREKEHSASYSCLRYHSACCELRQYACRTATPSTSPAGCRRRGAGVEKSWPSSPSCPASDAADDVEHATPPPS